MEAVAQRQAGTMVRISSFTDVAKALETSVVTWEDLKWIRAQWKGSITIKGVLTEVTMRGAPAIWAPRRWWSPTMAATPA